MKKIAVVLPILGIGLLLTGCNTDETLETKTIDCTLSTNDVINEYELKSIYKINYQGDYVVSVDTKEVITSEDTTVLDYFEATLKDTYSKTSEAYGGYDYQVVKDEGKVTSTVKIDYNKMDLEKFITDQPTLKSYVKDNKLLVTGVKSMYETMGATCSE